MISPENKPEKSDPDKSLAPWAKALLRVMLRAYIFYDTSREGREPHNRAGFIQGTMIGTQLCLPAGETLRYAKAPGGLWLAYDFNRPQVFPKAHRRGTLRRSYQGSIVAHCVEQIADQPPDTLTPTTKYDLFNADTLLTQDTYTPAQLVAHGFLTATTQARAFENVGRAADVPLLESRGVANDPVFQVTPKGNALVRLVGRGGDPEPKKDPDTVLSWIGAPAASPAF